MPTDDIGRALAAMPAEQRDKLLATLTPQEERVLRMRFGIAAAPEHRIAAVGADSAVVQRLEARALRAVGAKGAR